MNDEEKPKGVPLDVRIDRTTEFAEKENVSFKPFIPQAADTHNPTLLETAGANFRQYNDVYRATSYIAGTKKNPYRDEWEEGYNPIEAGLLDQIPDNVEFKMRVMEGNTLQEGQQIVKNINQELQDNQIRDRSGFFANTVTTLGASILTPSILIPVSQTLKYATLGKGIAQNAMFTFRTVLPGAALQNAILTSTKETEGMKEWVQDTLTDTLIATGLGGVLGAFAAKAVSKELKTAKAFFKAAENDIDIRYKMSDKGEINGMIAIPRDASVGAAQVQTVQQLLDSGEVSFKNNKVIKNTLGYMQPIIGMLTSRYKTVSSFADEMFSHINPVAAGNIHAIKDPAAENFARLWRATFSNLQLMTKQHWHDYIGYNGPGKGINATFGEFRGKWMPLKEFNEEVGRAIRRGGDSTIPEAGEAAKKWIKEQYDPLWSELKLRRPDLQDSDYTNIAHYLNRVYHKGKIQERPDEFVSDLLSFIDRGNKEIEVLNAPLIEAKANIKKLKEMKSKAKGTATNDYEKMLADAETKHTNLVKKIDEDIRAGKIGQELLDPNDRTKLRKVLTSEQMRARAEMIRSTILNENEEQMVGRIFDSITGSGTPGVLKERTLLWNDIEAEKWLVDDIDVLGGLYMDQLSKRIHADDVLLKYGVDPRDGMKGYIELFKKEHDEFRNAILEKPASPERAKELKKLDKEFKKYQKMLENSYAVYMGSYIDQSKASSRISNGIKQFTAATLLGNVPILQLTELFTPMFRFMFSEYIQDGLLPTLSRCKYIASQRLKEWGGENVDLIRGSFADAGLGMNMANGAKMQSLFGYGTQYEPKTLVERYVQNLANASSQVNLSNAISDFQETAVAFTSQAKTIRTLKRYLDGKTLTKEEIARLDVLRLNPEKWGKKIVEQFEKHGEEIDGSYVSNFHKWDDDAFGASQVFRIALEKEVRSIITKPNLLDIPFGMRDPLISLMTQFLSWSFASTLNFGLPTLTAPDKQKFIGLLLMMASGAMIDPLRQLAKGEEIDMDPRALGISAMSNSGVFGWPWDAIQKLNAAIDIPLLRPFQADRFKRKGAAALIGGPWMGLGDSALSVMSALVNGEMNQKDAQKAVRLMVPFSGTWFTRQPIDGVLKSFDIPETREKARALKEAE